MKNYSKLWRETLIGRAKTLLHRYNQKDLEYNRGEGDLTPQWIIENIFSKPCAHCGETDWTKIGCNRLDNSKPHTMDNVEPCCKSCNNKLAQAEKKDKFSFPILQINTETNERHLWKSANEVEDVLGYSASQIRKCANGGYWLKGKWYNSYAYKNCLWKQLSKI